MAEMNAVYKDVFLLGIVLLIKSLRGKRSASLGLLELLDAFSD